MFSYQKTVSAFTALILLTAGFFTLTSMIPHRCNFSGEWKLNNLKTRDGNFLCIYDPSDRMWSKTMKIAEEANALTIQVSNSFPNLQVFSSREKLTFDGKESEVKHVGRSKKFTAKLSPDGRSMTVNSVVYCLIEGKNEEFKVTEIWKLMNGGNTIAVHYDVASISQGDRVEDREYDKVN